MFGEISYVLSFVCIFYHKDITKNTHINFNCQRWAKEQRFKLGQRLLRDLSEDILVWSQVQETHILRRIEDKISVLKSELEIDGYIFRDGKLYFSETAILDTQDEIGILVKLIQDLELNNQDVIKHHLNLSETHFIDEKWDDSIANSRKFLESTLREISSIHHLLETSQQIDNSIYSKPYQIRDYLEAKELIEPKEKDAISKVYGLLSETGSHPYIAQKDQARLMRYLALTFAQFVLLRLQGFFIVSKGKNTPI